MSPQFSSREKFEPYSYLENARTKANNILMDGSRHAPLPNSALNVKFGLTLDTGSEAEMRLLRREM